MASRMARAARTARSASLPWATGAPNTAMTQSPTCLSTRPPCSVDEAVGAGEEVLQERVHLLRVELAGERGVAGEVGEEDRDLPPLAGRLLGGGLARPRA